MLISKAHTQTRRDARRRQRDTETLRERERERERERDTRRHPQRHRDTQRHAETHRDAQRHTITHTHNAEAHRDTAMWKVPKLGVVTSLSGNSSFGRGFHPARQGGLQVFLHIHKYVRERARARVCVCVCERFVGGFVCLVRWPVRPRRAP